MQENPGQEQRAFLAVLLAMGVLLVWSLLFPSTPPPTQRSATEEVAGEGGLPEPTALESSAPIPRTPGQIVERELATERETPSAEGAAGSLLSVVGSEGRVLTRADSGELERVTVRTDGENLSLAIDGRGARLTEVVLRKFVQDESANVQLLPEGGPGALGSVLVVGDRQIPLDSFVWRRVADDRTTEGRRIVFELPLEEVVIRKTFVVPDAGNLIRVTQELVEDRVGLSAWGLSWAGGMRVTEEREGNQRGAYFHGCVFAEGKVQRKEPRNVRDEPLEFPGTTYFVTSQNQYFLGAIVPRGDAQGPAKLWKAPGAGDEGSGLAAEILVERSGALASNRVDYDIYIGPLDYARLQSYGNGLEGTVDLGMAWIRPLSRTILKFLIWMHGILPNYGVVIVLFSSMINLLFFPLTYKSTKSMRDMSALKPRLDALKDKYKDEPQKMSEATMRLYKEAGVNPLAGCLPLVVQMPIFFALYAVLFHTIELRQAPFFAWIQDLSQPDVIFHLPFALPFVGTGIAALPIIMGVTSYFQSKTTMVDPNQKMMVVLMPVMMTFIFFTMPSGLVLYWLTSNLFTIGTKFFLKPAPAVAALAEVPDAESKPPGPKSGGKGSRKGKGGGKKPARAGSKG